MAQFRRLPDVVDAIQWFKNGDHLDDYTRSKPGLTATGTRMFAPSECRAQGWEGDVVRYYRNPYVAGAKICQSCSQRMHDHGWIDSGGDGVIVCPGDFLITDIYGRLSTCAPKIFGRLYEAIQ